MRRLAPGARYRWPRRQDGSPNGWTTIKNGELLARAARHFEVFITVDRSLPFQQNLASLPIAVIIVRAKSNRLADLRRLTPQLLAAIESARAGAAKFVEGDRTVCFLRQS
jgi:hypothetical protein